MHNNKIKDSEPHFIIAPSTRTITNTSADNNIIVQYDHNSERFTFEIPRYVDGHDMSECTEVRVNYRNSASTGLSKNDGAYICEDLAICEEDEDKVTFSWLLSSASTQYIGYLYFSIQFICYDDAGTAIYSWNTGIYKDIVIVESINNIEEAVASDSFKELNDLILDTKETLSVAESVTESANMAATNANAVAEQARASICYVRKTTDGKLQMLNADMVVVDTVDIFSGDDDTLHRYLDGMLSVVGIKELNEDKTYRVWVGTHDEYIALDNIDPDTFYWVTDDKTWELFIEQFNELASHVSDFENALEDGSFIVGKAESLRAGDSDFTAAVADWDGTPYGFTEVLEKMITCFNESTEYPTTAKSIYDLCDSLISAYFSTNCAANLVLRVKSKTLYIPFDGYDRIISWGKYTDGVDSRIFYETIPVTTRSHYETSANGKTKYLQSLEFDFVYNRHIYEIQVTPEANGHIQYDVRCVYISTGEVRTGNGTIYIVNG